MRVTQNPIIKILNMGLNVGFRDLSDILCYNLRYAKNSNEPSDRPYNEFP